jgi:Ca-activated chloride channel family protein
VTPELEQLRKAGKQGQTEEAGLKEKLAEIEARKAIRSTETLAQKVDADRLEAAPAPAKPDDPPVVAARGDVFVQVNDNPFVGITDKDAESRRSTFSIDVDTASYTYLRKGLQQGVWPPPDAVRIEELVNFFTYDDPTPKGADPLAIHVEVADCPWNRDHALARIALRAKPIDLAKRPPSNLVFLVDVSGSMDQPDKLPLVKAAMRMLARELGENDKIAVVVYAGNAGLVLEPTRGHRRAEVASAIDQLEAGGSTNGGEGISLAYDLAAKNFISNGTNRVILATDGDFNVGVTDRGDLVKLIEGKSKTGVFLNVLGVGQGNLKDATMEQLADKGNGVYAYLDTLEEAKRVLVDQIGSTLVTVAKDVKIQVDFNPTRVKSYRQIGYENRHLANEDFANDAKDAGEIGAGHSVTALYELELPPLDDKLAIATKKGEDLFTVRVRYKEPTGSTSKLMERPVGDFPRPFADASVDYRFSASVAAFGMILRHSPHKGTATLDGVLETAGAAIGPDKAGYRKEFLDLVRRAKEVEPKPEVAGEAAPR